MNDREKCLRQACEIAAKFNGGQDESERANIGKALFVVAIIMLTLVATIMVLISTLNTVIKILMVSSVFVSLAALITRWE